MKLKPIYTILLSIALTVSTQICWAQESEDPQEAQVIPEYQKALGPNYTNRETLFKKAYRLIPVILDHFGAKLGPYHSSNAYKLKNFMKESSWENGKWWKADYSRFPRGEIAYRDLTLWFIDTQGNFILKEEEPPRTAVTTGADRHAPIMINQKIINDKRNQFDLLSALQLMLHEAFHYIGPKNQVEIDATIAELITLLRPYYREIKLPNGEKLMIFSLPPGGQTDMWAPLVDGGFAVLKEGAREIKDWTDPIGRELTKETILSPRIIGALFEGDAPLIDSRRLLWMSESLSTGSHGQIFIRAHVSRTDRVLVDKELTENRISLSEIGYSFPSQKKENDFVIELTKTPHGEYQIQSVQTEKSYPLKESQNRTPEFKIEREKDIIKISTTTDELVTENSHRLRLQLENYDLELSPTEINSEQKTLLFQFSIPQGSDHKRLRIRSLVNNQTQETLPQQMIDIDLDKINESPSLEIKEVLLQTPDGFIEAQEDIKAPEVLMGDGLLKLKVQSDTEVNEIRLNTMSMTNSYEKTDYERHQPYIRGDFDEVLMPTDMMNPSREFSQNIMVLTKEQFQQRRDGPFIFIEIPLKHEYERSQTHHYATSRRKISVFYTMETELRYLAAYDTGYRRISEITVTNSNLKRARFKKPLPYIIKRKIIKEKDRCHISDIYT